MKKAASGAIELRNISRRLARFDILFNTSAISHCFELMTLAEHDPRDFT